MRKKITFNNLIGAILGVALIIASGVVYKMNQNRAPDIAKAAGGNYVQTWSAVKCRQAKYPTGGNITYLGPFEWTVVGAITSGGATTNYAERWVANSWAERVVSNSAIETKNDCDKTKFKVTGDEDGLVGLYSYHLLGSHGVGGDPDAIYGREIGFSIPVEWRVCGEIGTSTPPAC